MTRATTLAPQRGDKLSAIWSELGMGKRTFDTHLDSIYRKLDTRKRSGLARVAIRWGVA